MVSTRVIDESFLQSFAEAWNRHDIDSLMTFMTPDCVFESSMGASSCGTRYEGPAAVRAGFARAWEEFPDAQWLNATHFVCGNRGVSEWTFVGTRRIDGKRIETNGCDIFTFDGARIRLKNSWRKATTT
jgi:hypothetical protein